MIQHDPSSPNLLFSKLYYFLNFTLQIKKMTDWNQIMMNEY